jgi:hypothetical protein
MKTREIFSVTGKRAEDYSEIELFRLLEKSGNSYDKDTLTNVVLTEIREQQLQPSAEEGMKLLKALTEVKTFSIGENKNE